MYCPKFEEKKRMENGNGRPRPHTTPTRTGQDQTSNKGRIKLCVNSIWDPGMVFPLENNKLGCWGRSSVVGGWEGQAAEGIAIHSYLGSVNQ